MRAGACVRACMREREREAGAEVVCECVMCSKSSAMKHVVIFEYLTTLVVYSVRLLNIWRRRAQFRIPICL